MRGHLIIMAGGATLAVGALVFAATSAYAAPIPTHSSAIADAPALVVPANIHPTAPVSSPSTPSAAGVIRVAPGVAVDITAGHDAAKTTAPSSSPPDAPQTLGGGLTAAVPPVISTPPASSGEVSSSDKSSSNGGNDVNDKVTGKTSGSPDERPLIEILVTSHLGRRG